MIEKIKSAANCILTLGLLVLGFLFSRKSKQLSQAQSDLAKAVSSKELAVNDQAREAAKNHADALVDEFERSRR